jgi:hypothetical protein
VHGRLNNDSELEGIHKEVVSASFKAISRQALSKTEKTLS